jgi:hypothetical protein
VLARQIILFAVGIVLILLAVAMMNVAIYAALSEHYGKVTGALVVSVLNGIIAIILMVVAKRTKPGPEADMAKEIRGMVITEINSDVENVVHSLNDLKTDVRRIRSGFGGLIGGKGGSSLSLLNLAPILDIFISALSKSKKG